MRSRELGLSESALIVARTRLHQVFDQAYVLEAAVEDVQRDLAVDDGEAELRRAVDWLITNAQPLLHLVLNLQ